MPCLLNKINFQLCFRSHLLREARERSFFPEEDRSGRPPRIGAVAAPLQHLRQRPALRPERRDGPVRGRHGLPVQRQIPTAHDEEDEQDDVHHWTDQWRVGINADKSQAILFSLKRKRIPEENLTINGDPVQWCSTAKYLGVTFDHRLSWKPHITATINKAKGAFLRLNKLLLSSNNVFLRRKIQIYKTIIRPKITYGCSTWRNASRTLMDRLEATQSRMLRRIVGAPWYSRNADIRRDLGMPSLKDHIEELTRRTGGRINKDDLLQDHQEDPDDIPRRKRKRPLDF